MFSTLFLPIFVLASQGPCAPAADLLKNLTHCEENSIYLKHSTSCREQLEKEVQKAGLSLALKISSSSSTDEQNAKFLETVKDLAAAQLQLSKLISLSKGAFKDLDSYQDSVVHPEDIENPDIAGPDPQAFAESVPCYADTMRHLEAEKQKIRSIENDLQKSLALVSANSSKVSASSGSMGQLGNAANSPSHPDRVQISNQKPSPEKLPISKPSKTGASDISGSEKLNKDPSHQK